MALLTGWSYTRISDSSAGPWSTWARSRSKDNVAFRIRFGGSLTGRSGVRSVFLSIVAPRTEQGLRTRVRLKEG